jgi:hypothetical protein
MPISIENKNKRLEIVTHIVTINGYTSILIDNLYKKKLLKQATNDIYSRDNDEVANWRRLKYIASHQVTKSMPGFSVAFYNRSNLKNYTKGNVEAMNKSGIYELHCDDCSAIYIGQTKREFKERMKENKARFRKNNYFSVRKSSGRKNNWSNFYPKILYFESKVPRLDCQEIYDIFRLLNRILGIIFSMEFYIHLVPLS